MLRMKIMEERMLTIKNILNGSKTFALILSKNFKEYELLAREALLITLKENGFGASLYPENPKEFNEEWRRLIPDNCKNNGVPRKTTSILIPKEIYDIKEIFCGEDDDFFFLDVNSESELDKNHIAFKEKPPVFDAVFFFGGQNCEYPDKFPETLPLPAKEKIICISADENKTASKKVSEIIENIREDSPVSKAASTFLFASLLLETGARKEKKESLSFAQLFGRALARSRNNETLQSVWTFISKEDLEKTGNSEAKPELFYKISRKCREIIPINQLAVIVWQNESGIQAIISEKNSGKYLEIVGQSLKARKENGFIITETFASFSEAELEIQKAIKEALLK